MNVNEYILLTLEERQKHLDLSEPCQFGSRHKYRKSLLKHLGIKDDLNSKVLACHKCLNNSTTLSPCENPRHMYLGTAKENTGDISSQMFQKLEQKMLDRLKKHDEVAWRLWVYGSPEEPVKSADG